MVLCNIRNDRSFDRLGSIYTKLSSVIVIRSSFVGFPVERAL